MVREAMDQEVMEPAEWRPDNAAMGSKTGTKHKSIAADRSVLIASEMPARNRRSVCRSIA